MSLQKNKNFQLQENFLNLRNPEIGKKIVKDELAADEKDTENYLSPWLRLSKLNEHVYPSQGLLITPNDYLSYHTFQMLPQEDIIKTLRLRHFLLKQFNHPYRIQSLEKVSESNFQPPPKINSIAIESAIKTGLSLSIGDIGAIVTGSHRERTSRNERYGHGPFVKLGKQARGLFAGSSSPDVWNSAPAIATMAASLCLSNIPRNGVTSDITRQADLAKETFDWLKKLSIKLFTETRLKNKVLKYWQNNVCATISANHKKELDKVKILYKAGVRTFRIYSPEPGTACVETLKILRKKYKDEIEIFVGQIVDVSQAQDAQKESADGLYVGIGGGGRCITGVRSGSVVDWPELIWKMRGEVKIPVIVEGGASDHVSTTLLLGASGIGVSRVVAGGTIESPGGCLFCSDENGKLFKPYGGEASARTKFVDKKTLPFNIPSFVEGETTKAQMSYVKFVYPTLTYNLHLLIEDAILSLVFRNVDDISELQRINPSPLRQITGFGNFQTHTH